MRKWWKKLRLLAGGLLSLGAFISSASAQYPPGGGFAPPNMGGGMPPNMGGGGMPPNMGFGGGMPPNMGGGGMPPNMGGGGMPPGMGFGGGMPPMGGGMPPMGGGMPPGMGFGMPPMGSGMPPGMGHDGPPPGAFGPSPNQGIPADFPNPAQKSPEAGAGASPFSIKDEGMPNAFTDLIDPRPRLPDPYVLTFRGEYLNWTVTSGPSAAVLLTTNSNFPVEVGALGQPHTSALVGSGNDVFDYGQIGGFRLTMGLAIGYIPPIEISGFSINRTITAFAGGSLTNPTQLLAVPVQDVSQPINSTGVGAETAVLVAAPFNNVVGVLGGSASITSQLDLWGIEVNTFFNCIDSDWFKCDLLVGYRHIYMGESLNINTTTGGPNTSGVFFGGATQPAGFSVSSLDSFQTRNEFDGGQLGLHSIFTFQRLSLFADVKLAIGDLRDSLSIYGVSTLSQPVAGRPTQSLPGGILALPSNIGTHSLNTVTVIPETSLTLSYQLHPHFRLFGGYNFLYLNNVLRPGDAVNNIVDSRQIPTFGTNYSPSTSTANPPIPVLLRRDVTISGFFVGMELEF